MRFLRPWMFGLASFLLYAWNLGAADLVTDEAKDALNVPYPHPPLVRFFMKLCSELTGRSEFGARLPSALLGAASVMLVFMLLKRIFKRQEIAALGAVVFALLPPHLTWVRTAFLSPATEFAWLTVFYGLALIHDEPERPRGHWIAALGLVFGMWSNIQTVLIYPAYYLKLLRFRPILLKGGGPARAAIIAGIVSPCLLGLYIVSVRSVLGDFGRFLYHPPSWSGGLLGWLATTPLGWSALASLAAAAAYVVFAKAKRVFAAHPAADAAALSIPILTAFCVLSPSPYYGPYYAATGGFLAIFLIASLPRSFAISLLAATLVPLVLLLPKSHRHPENARFFHEHRQEIAEFVEGEPALAVAGVFGYQIDWYVPVPVVSFEEGVESGLKKFAVFVPESVTQEMQEFLAGLRVVKDFGRETLYERP